MVDKLMIEDTDSVVKFSPFEYQLKFKTTGYGYIIYDKYYLKYIHKIKHNKRWIFIQ